MKKILATIFGIAAVAVVYYFVNGQQQLTEELRHTVKQELTQLESKGFTTTRKTVTDNRDHVEIVFDDSEQISSYFRSQGVNLTVDDAKALEGTVLGLDIAYLRDTYSALSFDLYPLRLPPLQSGVQPSPETVKLREEAEALFRKKTFLLHTDVNKLFNGFKGYLKDINETFEEDGEELTLTLEGFLFEGEIEAETITALQQSMKRLALEVPDNLLLSMDTMQSDYSMNGATPYDTESSYQLKEITLESKEKLLIQIQGIEGNGHSVRTKNLLKTVSTLHTESMTVQSVAEEYNLTNLTLIASLDNLDIPSLEKFQKLQPMRSQEITETIQTMLDQGIRFGIPEFSLGEVVSNGHALKGFHFMGNIQIDPSLNLAMAQINPLFALNAFDANATLTLSPELFSLAAQNPKTLMAVMMFHPQEINGSKVYDFTLQKGQMILNGQPL